MLSCLYSRGKYLAIREIHKHHQNSALSLIINDVCFIVCKHASTTRQHNCTLQGSCVIVWRTDDSTRRSAVTICFNRELYFLTNSTEWHKINARRRIFFPEPASILWLNTITPFWRVKIETCSNNSLVKITKTVTFSRGDFFL